MPGRSGRDEMQAVAPARSFGAPLGAQAPVNATDRPKVGPAPIDVQRAQIAKQQADSAKQARAGLYQKPVGSQASSPPAASVPSSNPTQDLSAATAVNRIAARPGQIDNAVDDAQK